MTEPSQLTPYQIAAIEKDAPRLLLVASAGSGKTEVLTRRVIRSLEASPGETSRILAVTFTVRAAQELQRRIRANVASEAWRVDADTVHGFALDWLMRFGQAVNVYPDTIVYSEDTDRLDLLHTFLTSLGESSGHDLRPILKAIDDHRLDVAAGLPALPVGAAVGSVPFDDVYEGYVTALEAANGIDFAGMLSKFIEAATLDSAFIDNFSSTYRHVLVDEGQDLSAAQAAVIERLVASPSTSLFVVADDRQSINGFAGGSFANVRALVGDTACRDALTLPHNFRCATSVLEAAERVASNLRDRPPNALPAENAPPGAARLIVAGSPADEAEQVARWVQQLLSNGLAPEHLAEGEDPTVQAEDIAIIARARWLLDPILDALAVRSVDVSIQTDAQAFLQSTTGRLLVEALSLANSGGENGPARRRLGDELAAWGIDLGDNDPLTTLRNSGAPELDAVARTLDGLTATNIEHRLASLGESANGTAWRGDVQVLQTQWSNYAVTTPANRRDLPGFVRHLAKAQQTRPSDPGVRVLTIHKVKGLEFKAVCVLGAYNGVLPDYRATTESDLDEERRAFYVAMTRASRELLVTYPQRTVDRYGRSHEQDMSMFAVEAALG